MRWLLQQLAITLDRWDDVRMKAYSVDLRRKVVDALASGTPKAHVARAFGLGISTVKRYVAKERRGEDLDPKRPPGKRRKLEEAARRLLERDLEERPAATLPQRREFLERVVGVSVSDSTVSRALRRMGFSRKKDRWERESATSS
jgi:transposase